MSSNVAGMRTGAGGGSGEGVRKMDNNDIHFSEIRNDSETKSTQCFISPLQKDPPPPTEIFHGIFARVTVLRWRNSQARHG